MPPLRAPAARALTALAASIALVALLATPASAYPAYFLSANPACGAQPTKATGKHRAPVADSTITFTVQGPGGKETRLCPGQAYTVTASFPQPRNALLSASSGAFDGSGCRVLTTSKVTSVSGTFRVPCQAADKSTVALRVTSATGERSAFLQSGVTLPVVAGCASSSCRGVGPSARSG